MGSVVTACGQDFLLDEEWALPRRKQAAHTGTMPNAEVSRADGIQFQSWLHARQYPADCSGSVGMYTRQDYFYSLGLGAQMVSL